MHSDFKSTLDWKSTGQVLLECSCGHVPALTAHTCPGLAPALWHHWLLSSKATGIISCTFLRAPWGRSLRLRLSLAFSLQFSLPEGSLPQGIFVFLQTSTFPLLCCLTCAASLSSHLSHQH